MLNYQTKVDVISQSQEEDSFKESIWQMLSLKSLDVWKTISISGVLNAIDRTFYFLTQIAHVVPQSGKISTFQLRGRGVEKNHCAMRKLITERFFSFPVLDTISLRCSIFQAF